MKAPSPPLSFYYGQIQCHQRCISTGQRTHWNATSSVVAFWICTRRHSKKAVEKLEDKEDKKVVYRTCGGRRADLMPRWLTHTGPSRRRLQIPPVTSRNVSQPSEKIRHEYTVIAPFLCEEERQDEDQGDDKDDVEKPPNKKTKMSRPDIIYLRHANTTPEAIAPDEGKGKALEPI
ncbi:hypothetical protein ANCCAN_07902 [Ancylostoma caninum]|uniref:Uncharacterized protein n=1 Tax=Ancylostoma caninum TaxID=29170 RepID=A0A368GNU6_ANCCA|nr:hypothetical protein ANCCAN_07902 [Ancylostoma caninum]